MTPKTRFEAETMSANARESLPIPPWSPYEIFSAFLIADGIFPMIVSGVIQKLFPMMEESTVFIYVQFTPFFTWMLLFILLGKMFHCSMKPYLGLVPIRPWKEYLFYSLMAITSIIAISILLSLFTQIGQVEATDPYEHIPKEKMAIIGFFAILTAPFIEELVFRGFLQSSLYKYFKPSMAIFITSLVFTLFHTAYSSAIVAWMNVMLLGVLFGYIRHRTGSVIPGMIGHLFNNILAALVIFLP